MQAIFFATLIVALLSRTQGLGFGFGYSQQDGHERLLGTSFGVPGNDRIFDYVVGFQQTLSISWKGCRQR